MNLLLFAPDEVGEAGRIAVRDARAAHLLGVLHAAPGDRFQAGLLDGPVGEVEVLGVDAAAGGVSLRFEPRGASLAPWYDLVLALTRPRSLRRIFFQSAAMGVRTIYLVGAEKVEKSYFRMHLLREEEYRPILIDGLMQGKTTRVPRVCLVRRLRELWDLLPDEGARLIANPADGGGAALADAPGAPIIAIGPDGGWTEAENAAFAAHGFAPISLGPRPLRTDTAAIALPAVVGDRLSRQ